MYYKTRKCVLIIFKDGSSRYRANDKAMKSEQWEEGVMQSPAGRR